MLKRTCLVAGVMVALFAMAEVIYADSVSFSTTFSGTTLDSSLTAPYGADVVVNDGLTVTAAGDIWGGSINAPTVRYDIDSADTRDFTIESVLTSRTATGEWTHSGIILSFDSGRTGMYGPFYPYGLDHLRYEDNVNSPTVLVSSGVDDSSFNGTELSFAERVTRHGSTYNFYYKETSSSDWTLLGTQTLESTGPSWVGLFGKHWSGGGSDVSTYSSFSFTVVPEPSTLILMACGLFGLLAYAWRRRR